MFVLGLSAFGDSSGACLLNDGVPVAAAMEERFTRVKADARLPKRAAWSCLRRAGIEPDQLECVVFFEKPLRRFERTFVSQLGHFPRSCGPFAEQMFLWLGERLWLRGHIAAELGIPMEKLLFTAHHAAHAAGAFFASGFEEAAVLCLDGAGEWDCTSLYFGQGARLRPLGALRFPHSLACLVSSITQFLGFIPGTDDHKLGELAALGEPRFAAAFEQLLSIHPDGSYSIDQRAFRYAFDEQTTFAPELERLLGPRRVPGSVLRSTPADRRDADVAASLYQRLKQALDGLLAELKRRAPSANLCLAGSLAADPWLNAHIVAQGGFERVFAAPAPRDAGASLGAALYAWHAGLGGARMWRQTHAFLGEDVRIDVDLDCRQDARRGERIAVESAGWSAHVAERLARGQLVGVVRGASEFSPRSLGHRSLLANAADPDAKRRINQALKRREEFRPLAVAVPDADAERCFEIPTAGRDLTRFKLLAVRLRPEVRARVPHLAHDDGTCVVQCVDPQHDPHLAQTLQELARRTGLPLAYCVALNARGDTPARTHEDALRLFERSAIDALVVEDLVYAR